MNTKDGKIFNQGIKIGVHNEREAKKKQKGFFEKDGMNKKTEESKK